MTTLPRGRAFTREDLESMPDDGHRYELIDGTLVVTPAPSYRHQDPVGHILLTSSCPADMKVLLSPFDVALADDTVMQPDLLVARLEAAGCPSYWAVDPDEPAFTAWELRDGGYVEVAHVTGVEGFVTTKPFPVAVSPAALQDWTREFHCCSSPVGLVLGLLRV